MPLDGITVSALKEEFQTLINSRIEKVYQPERDELNLAIRTKGENYKLVMSANSAFPRIHFTENSKKNPQTAPAFCMLLRKNLTGGRIINIEQPLLERILIFHIEGYNELGDLTIKKLIIEIMGKHSNIILVGEENKIIDSIKRVDFEISRARQILPGLTYALPPSQNKINPKTASEDDIFNILNGFSKGMTTEKCVLNGFMGVSPLIAREACFVAGVENIYMEQIKDIRGFSNKLYNFFQTLDDINPCIIYQKGVPFDFSCIKINQYKSAGENIGVAVLYHETGSHPAVSGCLDKFYTLKDSVQRLKQKSSDLTKLMNNNKERCVKKIDILMKKIKEAENTDIFKLYGDLLISNVYKLKEKSDFVFLENFYDDNKIIKIPLDKELTASQNAQKYFLKYNKLKTALKTAEEQIEIAKQELEYLESSLDFITRCKTEEDINEIRLELSETGYLQNKKKEKPKPAKPLEFISESGFKILVGKNNKQNDYLTLKFAANNDIWLHTKEIPGSHTIIRTEGKETDIKTIEYAAALAALHSKARMAEKVPVDYTKVKNVKKPQGAKPGMVIYDNFKTVYINPGDAVIKKER